VGVAVSRVSVWGRWAAWSAFIAPPATRDAATLADPLTPRLRSTSNANSTRPPQKQFPSSHGVAAQVAVDRIGHQFFDGAYGVASKHCASFVIPCLMGLRVSLQIVVAARTGASVLGELLHFGLGEVVAPVIEPSAGIQL